MINFGMHNWMIPIIIIFWSQQTLSFILKLWGFSFLHFYKTLIDSTCVRVDLTRDRDMVFSETVKLSLLFKHPLKIQYNKVHTMFVLLQ